MVSQYRCETCRHYLKYAIACNKIKERLIVGADEWIDKVGCASHSDFQNQSEPTYQELVDFARWTQTFWKNGISIMRKNGLKIESDTPMEKLAFTFYSDLCEIDKEASHLFEEGYGEKNYKDESDILCQTIRMYPKPYDERIRQAEREKVLDEIENWIVEQQPMTKQLTEGLFNWNKATCQEIYWKGVQRSENNILKKIKKLRQGDRE